MQSQAEYERTEQRKLARDLQEVETAPLAERREARANFAEYLLQHPEIIAERVGWLLAGTYGYGSYREAGRIARADGRTNKVAQLVLLTAALEWKCPNGFAFEAWKNPAKYAPNAVPRGFSAAKMQKALDAAVKKEIKEALEAK